MSSALDMSLDDIIKSSKKSGSAAPGRGGRGSGGPGPARRNQNRLPRATPYAFVAAASKAPDTTWQHDLFVDQGFGGGSKGGVAARASSIETGTKLYISNLDYGVSNEDIKELFSEVGDLKRHTIHYDRSGRSKGTAEVVFSRRTDALAAVKRYNNVQLDGKPMRIEIVGTNLVTPVVPAVTNGSFAAPNVGFGNMNGLFRGGSGRGSAFSRGRGGAGGRRSGQGRGRGRDRGEKLSAEDLDADLEKYHTEAVETRVAGSKVSALPNHVLKKMELIDAVATRVLHLRHPFL
ncbi:hypothetical protein MLD38_017338 [Melastoma candidum]|uniref:Uncharacterized protein n=1 Tax=Melastoma candidum TaxID=119954 RepID=A0ACB9QUC8_9MYRT|nr:hypothetical protein MLD38_017338 [Melastoma candidum]